MCYGTIQLNLNRLFYLVSRSFSTRWANFPTQESILAVITNFPTFGSGLSGFSNNLQGTPHGIVHNYVGSHMVTMFSPGELLLVAKRASFGLDLI